MSETNNTNKNNTEPKTKEKKPICQNSRRYIGGFASRKREIGKFEHAMAGLFKDMQKRKDERADLQESIDNPRTVKGDVPRRKLNIPYAERTIVRLDKEIRGYEDAIADYLTTIDELRKIPVEKWKKAIENESIEKQGE